MPHAAVLEQLVARAAGTGIRTATAEVSDCIATLPAAERAVVANAVAKRKREFATGRVLSRRCLAELGIEYDVLLPGDDRVPQWPPGTIGSISHTDDLCAVAVARRDRICAIGLDIEHRDALSPRLWRQVLTAFERDWLETQPSLRRGELAKLVFSAKEAYYKAQHCLTRRFIGFQDVELGIDVATQTFVARSISGFAKSDELGGVFAWHDRWVFTVMVDGGS